MKTSKQDYQLRRSPQQTSLMSSPVYELVQARKTVTDGHQTKAILDDINVRIDQGEFCGIVGKSGAGKSTLLNILGGLDVLSAGHLSFMGNPLKLRTRNEMALFRRKIGVVFQSFQLIPHLRVFENIAMPLVLAGMSKDTIHSKVLHALYSVNFINQPLLFSRASVGKMREHEPHLAKVVYSYGTKINDGFQLDLDSVPAEVRIEIGGEDEQKLLQAASATSTQLSEYARRRINQYPKTLSGGEQQRVAIARAIVNDPNVILADEPTGSLDTFNENIILSLLRRLHQQKPGLTIIVVSHSETVVNACSHLIRLADGRVIEDKLYQTQLDESIAGEQG